MAAAAETVTRHGGDLTPEPSRADAVKSAVPTLKAETFPAASMVAIAGLLDAQLTEESVAFAGETETVSVVVWPTERETTLALKDSEVTEIGDGAGDLGVELPSPPQPASNRSPENQTTAKSKFRRKKRQDGVSMTSCDGFVNSRRQGVCIGQAKCIKI
jgi:hypothetical protein